MLDLTTPHGLARAHLHEAPEPRAALVLGHGAGGSVGAPDLQAVTRAAVDEGLSVALVEQPYRVAGRRSAAPAKQLDAAWASVVEQLLAPDAPLAGLPLIAGGRSSGARVACRTAAQTGAIGVLCLAFPLHPPTRGDAPPKTRLPELEAVAVPVLVVQGSSDRFGMPPVGPRRRVVEVRGDHALRSDTAGLTAAFREWIGEVLSAPGA